MDTVFAAASARVVRAGLPGLLAALVALAVSAGPLRGQDAGDRPLQLQGPTPVGGRASVTEGWGTLQFTLLNPNAAGRDARVAVFYPERPDVQYARDVWVPGGASVTAWLTVGPAPAQQSTVSRELRVVLHDRTGGTSRVVLPPGDERLRATGVMYRRREPTTTVMVDLPPPEPGRPEPVVPADVLTLARLARAAASLSDSVSVVHDGPLPLAPEALDGVDVFVLAGDRLAADPPGRAALRRWVQAGGRLWVMLDRVDPATVAPVLGGDFDVGVVDRVGLTTIRLRGPGAGPGEPGREVEQPVPFVRVLPTAADRVVASVDGWPAAFTRRVGRGAVLFTTLGAGGWARPRGVRDGASPYPGLRDFPVPLGPATALAQELHPPPEADPLPPDVFQPMLAEEIGYAVVGRGTAAAVLGGFVLALVGVGIGVRRSRRPERVGALVPLAAAAAALVFVALGERSRRAVPPTVGLTGLVDPVPGGDEAVVSGLYAVYQPASGPAALGTREGAVLGLDAEGLDGQTRVRVQTDTDAWHWDDLALPAGARTGSFRATLPTGRIAAVARFGPDGVEGRLTAGSFGGLSDAILSTPAREPLAVRLGPDGAFAFGPADLLPAGQYLAGAVLSDRQQRRQAVYRRLHTGPPLRHHAGRDLLFVWADCPAPPIARAEGARAVGAVLLAVPLEFERTPADTRVTVPRGLIAAARVVDGAQLPVTPAAPYAVDMRLRFQLPAAVLPLRVERATLFATVRAPARRVAIAGVRDGALVPLFQADAPGEPLRIDVTDGSLLRLDEQGGLYLNIAIGEPAAGDAAWKIESLSLEVVGRTGP